MPWLPSQSAGVNIINVLQAAFTCTDSESAKKVKMSVFFALLEYAWVTAARKMLMKLTPGVTVKLALVES
jgi:hypothetical protein